MLTQIGVAIVACLSYNMLLGQGGMLSFGHAVYTGLGSFVAVHAMLGVADGSFAIPMALVPVVGGLAGMFFAVLLGYVTTKKAGTPFAMITLGLGELVAAMVLMIPEFFGGEGGISANRTAGKAFLGITYGPQVQVYYLIAIYAFVCTVAMFAFTRTPLGRMLNAVRDNPERVEFIGYSTQRVRYLSFVIAGFFAGVAGGMYALNFEIATAEVVGTARSGAYLLFTFLGGATFFFGPIIGAILMVVGFALFSEVTKAWQLYLGLIFMFIGHVRARRHCQPDHDEPARRRPSQAPWPVGLVRIARRHRAGHARRPVGADRDGLSAPVRPDRRLEPALLRRPARQRERRQLARRARRRGDRLRRLRVGPAPLRGRVGPHPGRDRGDDDLQGADAVSAPASGYALELKDLRKSFGKTEIIRGTDLAVLPGERVAIIGPNGAGKSTLFNLISGRFGPTSGEILLNGKRIDGLLPYEINRLGLARSFQITNIFGRLSVFENLRCGVLWSMGYRYAFWKFLADLKDANARADQLLAMIRLDRKRDTLAMNLTYAEQRALEIGITIAGGADVVLLDEPTAGMSKSETTRFIELIREVTVGKTLLTVEHDMGVVFGLADKIAVLVYGEVIAYDVPSAVRGNARVQEAYLGSVHAEQHA